MIDNLKDKLLKEIHAGKVEMTPKAYFTLRWAALIAVSLAILTFTVFIFNFIFFSLRINSEETLLFFGPRGFGAFLRFFPWPLLIIDIGLIALLQYLLRNFRFGYRIPVLYLVGALILGAFTVGFALDRTTPLNDRLHEQREHLPGPMRGIYEGARRPPPLGSGFCRCTILSIDGNTLTVEDTRLPAMPAHAGQAGEATSTLTVILPDDDRRATTTGLKVGDIVFIAGEEDDGIIHAFGVKKERTDTWF